MHLEELKYFALLQKIKAKRIVIDYIINKHVSREDKISINPHSITISLKHMECREMVIKDIGISCTIEFFSGLQKLVIEDRSVKVALILPDSLKSLYADEIIIIGKLPDTLREIECYQIHQAPGGSLELPKTLEAFNIHKVDKGIYNAFLSCYKNLPLKSLTVSPEMQLDLSTLEGLQKLYLNDFEELEIPSLPPRLKVLHIICDGNYTRQLPELPKTLKEFRFVTEDYYFSISNLPNLETLELCGEFFERIEFPETLRKLTLYGYHHKIDFSKLYNLKTLRLGKYLYNLTDLCDGLEELIFEDFSSFDNNIILPNTLRKIVFGPDFNREVSLPESLEEVIFGKHFNRKIKLPSKLKRLYLQRSFNHEIDLPDSLEELYLSDRFDNPIKRLPPRLKFLRIGEFFSHPLPELPKTLVDFVDDRGSYDN
jgi:hypothetical protein